MNSELLKGKHFLIVDDEPMLREIMRFDLEAVGGVVNEASNGSEAFTFLQSHQVDVVISDVRMPGGSGIELLDKIQGNNNSSVKSKPIVILISAFSDVDEALALSKGAQRYYQKPCDCEKVLADLAVLLAEAAAGGSENSAPGVVWSDEFATGNEQIDHEHRALFNVINNLLRALHAPQPNPVFIEVYLEQLTQYPETHFRNEEALMEQVEYPDYAAHKASHDQLRGEVRQFKKLYRDGDKGFPAKFGSFLRNWIEDHVKNADLALEQYVSQSARLS